MKRIITFFTVFLMSAGIFAQTPEKMSYQAVIRDTNNEPVTNQSVGIKISILQGSVSGTPVYEETYNPNPETNGNGLVTVEIGNGLTISGDFSAIDWANGPYYIKTETDPAGGTNYTISGTSQLMSVPYALHANTAETANETDPIYTSSESANISATDITHLDNLSGTNTGDQDISGIAENTQAIQDTASQIRGDMPKYSVGDFAQGGIVFWVDETGQHGLVCAKEDQSTAARWYAGTEGVTQAKGDGPFAGEANTSIIIAAHVSIGDDGSTYAARICNELQITEGGKTYGDWYLPSKEELNLMYQNKAAIETAAEANGGSGFGDFYLSSTEFNSDQIWIQHLSLGNQQKGLKDITNRVRAVRAF